MKVSLKEWAKCPKAVVAILTHVVFMMVYFAINAWILRQIGIAVEHANEIWDYVTPLIGACIINNTLSVVANMLRKYALMMVYNNTENRFVKKISRVPYERFTVTSCDVITTIANHITYIVKVPYVLVDLIEDVWALTITLYAIYCIEPNVVIPIIAIYIIGGYIIRITLIKYGDLEKQRSDIVTARNKERAEIINGFVETRTFCRQVDQCKVIASLNNRIVTLSKKKFLCAGMIRTVFNCIDTIGCVLVLFYAAGEISAGVITPAAAVTLVMYVWRLADPLDDLANLVDVYTELSAYCGKFADFMAIPDEEDGTVVLNEFNDEIEIDDVSFGYTDTTNVLTNIHLNIKKGEKVGICGVSGGGKSTLLKLVPALYRDFDGQIRIDGVDVRKLRIDSVRDKIGYVHQDNHIFDKTIYENIVYGKPSASMDEVVEACKKASIYDFIMSLPDKFETNVGPRGLKLSGGQKQRISLARIFLKNADIIMLDEATSALDNESESIVQESLELFKDKTIITVAHRLSTIRNCDKIVVIDNHRIAEIGTHDELLKKGGIYAGLHR